MKVYLSVDMEGIAGISHWEPTLPGRDGYPDSVALMLAETNAAVEGAFEGGATEVVVGDSHGKMRNLPPAGVDPRAKLIQGRKPLSMLDGAGPDRGFDVALFVGYHTRAGAVGNIAHTYFGSGPTSVLLNGVHVGETGINAAVLGAWGIPVGLVTGDDTLAQEVEALLPWAERVVVKETISDEAALSIHPTLARDLVRDGARRAVAAALAGSLTPFVVPGPVSLDIEFHEATQAELVALLVNATRTGVRGIRLTADDVPTVFRSMLAALWLGTISA